MNKINVLIVEDENIVAKDIKETLEKKGYNVSGIVSTGEKAINKAEENHPDIVLMDIKLKGKMSGIDAAGVIKEKLDIPIIFLTAYADDSTVEKVKITEPYGYIIKPFKEQDLYTAVEMAVFKHEKDSKVRKEKEFYCSVVNNTDVKDSIFVRADFRLNKINFKDIFYVEALKDYVVIATKNNSYTTHSTMKEMVRILPAKNFIRIHRSYIVNSDKIFSIKYPDLILEDNKGIIPIGGLYRKELYGKLNLV